MAGLTACSKDRPDETYKYVTKARNMCENYVTTGRIISRDRYGVYIR